MQNGTVLVVDDDDDVREAILDLLYDEGVEALQAANGQEALALLRARPEVCLILLDMMMPIMDGAAFRMAQLAEPAIASIPFVLLTARMDCTNLATALGASACLQKPFRRDALRKAINRLCQPRDGYDA